MNFIIIHFDAIKTHPPLKDSAFHKLNILSILHRKGDRQTF